MSSPSNLRQILPLEASLAFAAERTKNLSSLVTDCLFLRTTVSGNCYTGHFGFTKSYATLQDSYYWPHMHRDLEEAYLPSCVDSQHNKSQTKKPTGPLHPLTIPDVRFDTVALDFVGPLPLEDGCNIILTMTDALDADIRMAAIHSVTIMLTCRGLDHTQTIMAIILASLRFLSDTYLIISFVSSSYLVRYRKALD
jgi:hypothetical protein